MKVFITGITGFVGSMLANKFAEDGFEVTGLGRKETLPAHVDKRCAYVREDIKKPISKIDADIVIHAAAQVDDNASYTDHFENNVVGTANVIDACSARTTLFILISTSSVYSFNEGVPYAEGKAGIEFETLSAYGKTKFLAEQKLLAAPHLMQKVILRPRAIYGPGDTVLVPRLLRLVKKHFILLPKHTTTRISLTHINNLIFAVQQCLSLQRQHYDTYVFNVADETIYSLKEAIPSLLQHVSQKNLKVVFIPKQLWIILVKINSKFHFIPELTSFGSRQLTQSAILDISAIKNQLAYVSTYNFTHL